MPLRIVYRILRGGFNNPFTCNNVANFHYLLRSGVNITDISFTDISKIVLLAVPTIFRLFAIEIGGFDLYLKLNVKDLMPTPQLIKQVI